MHTHTAAVTDLELSLQSKSLDEGVSHMIGPLKARCSLVLRTRHEVSITVSHTRQNYYKTVINHFSCGRSVWIIPTKIISVFDKHIVCSLVDWASRML